MSSSVKRKVSVSSILADRHRKSEAKGEEMKVIVKYSRLKIVCSSN